MDRVAQRKRSTRRTSHKVSIMHLLVTTWNQRPRELEMRRRRRPFYVTNAKVSAILEGSVRSAKRNRPVQRTRLEGGIPLSVRNVHGPRRKVHTKNDQGVQKEIRESGKREGGVNDDSSFRLNVSENAVSTHTVPIILEHGTPTISADIEGMSRGLILDTGSNISIMQPTISKSNVQVTTMEPFGVTGDILDIKGQQTVTFRMNGRRFTHPFLVSSLPNTAAGLLGTNFLSRLGAI